MKYVYTFLLLSAFSTYCGQNQTEVKKNIINSQTTDPITSRVPNSMVRNIKQARNGDILIASYNGVFRYDARLPDGQGKSFTNITSTIKSPSFWDVLEDRKGNLWFASKDSGVYYYNARLPDGQGKSLPTGQAGFQHFTTKDGLASNMVLSIYEDKTGNIWFGASRYDGKSFRNFTTKDGFPSNSIRLLLEDKTGKLWFGAQGENMFVYDGKTFTVLKNKDGKAFKNVWSIIEDKKGSIWFGDVDGLWRYDGSTYTRVSQKGAYAIIEDKKGNIWTTGGAVLSRYDAKSLYNKKPIVTDITFSAGSALLGILEANDGSIWFGSVGSKRGVYRYDARLPDGQGKTITDFKGKKGQK